jgi:hypothetical protein
MIWSYKYIIPDGFEFDPYFFDEVSVGDDGGAVFGEHVK